MARTAKANLKKVRTISIHRRKSKVGIGAFGKPFDPSVGSFPEFIASLPKILAAAELRKFVGDVVKSRRAGKPVIAMIGAHVVKVGLSPILVDLIERKVLTCVAMNSAAAIHDAETALWGVTSEDVAGSLSDGTFGMSRETGEFINGTLSRASEEALRGVRRGDRARPPQGPARRPERAGGLRAGGNPRDRPRGDRHRHRPPAADDERRGHR